MPYYSELGIYTGPSSSYPGVYVPGPYSNHSSIIASNFTRPAPSVFKPVPRNFRGYKPHLSTISESHSPLRRINSPKLLLTSTPKISVPRPIKINTADIDVSVNKYRKYDRPIRQKDDSLDKKSPSPGKQTDNTISPKGSFEEKEAKPNKHIRRDRATIRIQTIHKDLIPDLTLRRWRDNFDPNELYIEEEKRPRKTPGELLKEKFLIRDATAPTEMKRMSRRNSKKTSGVQKTPSFHDICTAITTDQIDELDELNPGQPSEIHRRQSRQISTEEIIKELKRNSADLSKELSIIEDYDSRGSVKKKKLTKKKSNEKVVLHNEVDIGNKSGIQRRDTHRKIKRTSTDTSVSSVDSETEKAYQEAIRDISQVEIEQITTKPKPVFTATVDVEEKPTLKAIIDEVEIVESPKPKKASKFKFNVIVEHVEDKKSQSTAKKVLRKSIKEEQQGTVHIPNTKDAVVSNILNKTQRAHSGQILKKIKEKPKALHETKGTVHLPRPNELVVTNVVKKNQKASVGNILEDIREISSKESEHIKVQTNEQRPNTARAETSKQEILSEETHSDKNCEDKSVAVLKKDDFGNKNKVDQKAEIKPVIEKTLPQTHTSIILSKSIATVTDQDAQQKTDNLTTNKTISIQIGDECRSCVAAAVPKPEELNQMKTINDKGDLKQFKTVQNSAKTGSKQLSDSQIAQKTLNGKGETQAESLRNSSLLKSKSEKFSQQNILQNTSINSELKKNKSEGKIAGPEKDENDNTENFWASFGRESIYVTPRKVLHNEPPVSVPANEMATEVPSEDIVGTKPMPSKRSIVNKADKDDPDLAVFVPPEPEPEPQPEPAPEKSAFVPLQSNRLSQFMHPFKKPEQFGECPVEIFARPKTIRKRHYPRPRHAPPPPVQESESSEEETDSESETTSSDDEDEEYDVNVTYSNGQVGASTSSNDSGFDSGVPGSRNKDCDVNCHKKCEKLTANLCGVNQKLIVEAIASVRKGSSEVRDSPTSNPAHNPAFALDSGDAPEEYSQSSTFAGFQKSGRITPPATTIPRFRKYCVEDFNFLKVLGKGSFGKVLLAELKGTEYYYAVKCLKKDVVLEDDDVECTLIERKVLALGTKHPYLCHLLCTFQTESHLFFVMEYLNGGDLMFHIQQSGRFPEPQAKFYGAEIVSGLKFLHNKGIVYRDLKLDNILLDFDGHVRIADFGMCKLQIFLDRMADTFCGTPDYMAPEIIKGLHYNQAVDWWSFGILLYEMLIGQSPFSGCDEDELFWSICNEKPVIPRFLSSEACAILLLLLEKDHNKRLGTRFCPSGDIQDQAFFKQIQWDKLEARQLEAPFKPNLQHPLDTQYFDKAFTVEKAKLTPIEQNILQSMDQSQFQGFSYTNPNATDK